MHFALSNRNTNNTFNIAEKVSSQREVQYHQHSSVHAQPIPQPVKSAPHESPSLSPFTDSHVVEAPPAASTDQGPDISGVGATHSVSDLFNNSGLPWSNSHASPNQVQVQDFELLHAAEGPHHIHDLAVFPQSTDAPLVEGQSTDQPLEVLAAHAAFSPPSTLHQPLPPWETQPLMPLIDSTDTTLSATETVISGEFIGIHPAPETSSHISSFGDNTSHEPFFESTSSQVLEQPIKSTHDEHKLDVSSRDQPIPFDSSLSGPSSPIFDREAMAVFTSPGRRQSPVASEYQTSSYSIMELASPMEPSQFFVQARQSPRLLNQFANLGSAPHVSSKSALEHPSENDVSSFDQVSLAEDLSSPTPAQEQTTHVSAPAQQKERGLASLFDPATLGAVEDLLNMPKSAAFERGRNRLFKAVKSSASSMFASPLVHSPPVPATSTTQDSSAHSQAHVKGSSGVSTTNSESQVPPTLVQDQDIKVTLPPPPRRMDSGPPLAANMPQRDSVNMQSSEASSSDSHVSTSAEAILPPPPRAEHMQAKNTLSPKLEGKSHKPPRVPRMQHDWAPKQPMFVNIESEVAQQESGDQSTTSPPEAQQSKDSHGRICDMTCVYCYPSPRLIEQLYHFYGTRHQNQWRPSSGAS